MSLEPQADPAPSAGWSESLRPSAITLLFAALGFLTVAGCLSAPLINLDDYVQVRCNPFLTAGSAWQETFTGFHYQQYIPVTHLSYRLNAALFGLETAWAYRLVNWLLHVASAVVLLRTLRALGVGRIGSLFIASVWVVHPLACETVGWVTERSNVLAFFFGLLSFHSYVTRGESWKGLTLSAFLFALALLSKPLALGWTPIFVAFEFLGGSPRLAAQPSGAGASLARPAIRRLLPFLLLSAGVTILGLCSYRETFGPPPGGSWFTALLTDLNLFARYAFNIVAPFRLSAFYAIDSIDSLGELRAWGWLGVWLVLLGGTVWLAASRRRAIFGWLWFFGALGPSCNIVAIGFPMQDRYVYLSSVGLLLVLVEAGAGLTAWVAPLRAWAQRQSRLATAVLGAYVALLGALALQRSQLWAEPLVLMEAAVEVQPESAHAHIFLAQQFIYKAWAANEATPPDPVRARALNLQAAKHFTIALTRPDVYLHNPVIVRMLLGKSLMEAGETGRAISWLSALLPLSNPGLAHSEDRAHARYSFEDGPCRFPYRLPFSDASQAHTWLARALMDEFMMGPLKHQEAASRLERAAQHCAWALQLDPDQSQAYFFSAYVFLLQDSFSTAPEETAQEQTQTVLRTAQPYLFQMCAFPEVTAAFRSPCPAGRPKALACLGMAGASFGLAQRPDATPQQAAEELGKTLSWARRAVEFDSSFGENYWFLAHVHLAQARSARARNDVAGATKSEAEAIGWLSKIAADSPRYGLAQQALSALRTAR